MGDRLTEEDGLKLTENPSYGDIFDELFPHYLLMGMTPEEYWDGESSLKKAYRKAYQLRIENEQRLADRNNWYLGQYFLYVLHATPLLVGGLNVKPGKQLPEYPNKPFFETFEEQKKEEVRKRKEEDQQKLAMALFQASLTKFNQNVEKRLKQETKAGETGQHE